MSDSPCFCVIPTLISLRFVPCSVCLQDASAPSHCCLEFSQSAAQKLSRIVLRRPRKIPFLFRRLLSLGAPLPARRPREPAGERLPPGGVALLGASSPLPASQPPCPSGGKGVACAASGHWLGMESLAGPVLGRLSGALPGVGEGPSGRGCQVLGDPSRAGSLTAARGRPSACDLPFQAWFLLSPGISAVLPRSAF